MIRKRLPRVETNALEPSIVELARPRAVTPYRPRAGRLHRCQCVEDNAFHLSPFSAVLDRD